MAEKQHLKKHGAYPKCRPSKRVSSDTPETSGEMSKDEKASAVRQKRKVEKKRRKDKKPHMASHEDIKEQTYTPSKEFKAQVLDAIKAKSKGLSRKDLMKQMKERYKFVPGIAFEKLLDAALEWWEESAEIVNMGGVYTVADSVNKESTKESVEIEEATLVTVRVKIANKAAWKKIEPLIASIDSWKESDWNGDKGTGAFMFDASKHTQSDRKKVAEFIKNTKGIEFDHSVEEDTQGFTGKRFSDFVAEVADKESMPCNKPRPSTRPGKKRMVKACQDGQEKIVHYGADGYGHNYSAKARSSFRARHNCDQAKDKLGAQYWACKDLWAGKGGSTKGCPGGKDDPDCKY